MPRTRSLAWAELKIGLVSILALMMAGLLIFLLSGEGGFFWQRVGIKTIFANVAGLKAGAPVRLAGVEVGSVKEVQFLGDRVEVLMEVGKKMQPRITSSSVASLGSVSLLGESAVDITASSVGTPVPEWGYVRSGPAAGSLTDVAEKASAGIDQLSGLIGDLRAGKGTMGRLFTEDTVHVELNELLSAYEQVARNLNNPNGSVARLTRDPTMAKALEGSLQNLEAVTARIRSGEGSLGKLLNDDAMAKSVTSLTANLDTATARMNRGDNTMGKLFTEKELYDRVNSMSERFDKVAASLQQKDGTVGLLLHDKAMYEKFNGTLDEARALIAAIKADPKKYLNIRVSLF
ncbi:MAG TPA: MlaD family protein [Vicinamibacterales bacterium]|jgi:phospholipid/cholesterol/gamma-HCH transport system substrate-binding protein|nr:MlaD family protein [Vicinamibacterales bacterium]